MSHAFFSLMNEINTYGCALRPSSSKPTAKPMPVDKKSAPPATELPAELKEALEAPMPQRPGMTVGDHLAEFDSWVDCNGTTFDRLVHMGLSYSSKDKAWKAPPMDWSSKIPWDEPEKEYSTEVYETTKTNKSNNSVLNRILNSSIGATGRGRKRPHQADEAPTKVSKRKVEPTSAKTVGRDVLQHAKQAVPSTQLKKPLRGAVPTKSRTTNATSTSKPSTASSARKGSPLKQQAFAYSDSENEHPNTAISTTAKKATAKKTSAPKKPAAATTNKRFAKSIGMKLTRGGMPKPPSDHDDDATSMSAMATKLTPGQIAARKANKETKC